jgi:hypothetical protein
MKPVVNWDRLPLSALLERLEGRLSPRQMRLAACAVARLMGVADQRRHREAIELAEAFADGRAAPHQLAAARFGARSLHGQIFWLVCWPPGSDDWPRFLQAVEVALLYSGTPRSSLDTPDLRQQAADLIRDIAGNLDQEISLQPLWGSTPAVRSLAQAIYDERDFAALPILADALEEAGCTDARLIEHARQIGTHTRGCWLLDLLLGKQ